MAKETPIEIFLGTDVLLEYTILDSDEDAAVEITGWALSFMIKPTRITLDADALVTKTTAGATITISGTYNADPDTNTQVATVSILDTNTSTLDPQNAWWELKRTDDGFETVLAYGRVNLIRSVHR